MSPASVPIRSTSLNASGSGPPSHDLRARVTDDLFLGAYLVAEGARLAGTELGGPSHAQRPTVSFVLEAACDELAELESAYARGEARTNVLRFKSALTHLKDVMFARLREETRGEARCRLRPRSSTR